MGWCEINPCPPIPIAVGAGNDVPIYCEAGTWCLGNGAKDGGAA